MFDDSTWPLVERTPTLEPDEVHVWQSPLDCDDATVKRAERLLSVAERERSDRFHFARDRRRYIVGRGWLRVFLGGYLQQPPAEVQLESSPQGKPRICANSASDLRFNVAHSDDSILLAFSRNRELGVDLEREKGHVAWRDLAERYFAPEESAMINAMPPALQQSAFYRCWTCKEAYVKALGFGLQVPLEGFAVSLTPDQPIQLIHTAHDPKQRDRWELRDISPGDGFAAALAVEGRNWRFIPRRRYLFP